LPRPWPTYASKCQRAFRNGEAGRQAFRCVSGGRLRRRAEDQVRPESRIFAPVIAEASSDRRNRIVRQFGRPHPAREIALACRCDFAAVSMIVGDGVHPNAGVLELIGGAFRESQHAALERVSLHSAWRSPRAAATLTIAPPDARKCGSAALIAVAAVRDFCGKARSIWRGRPFEGLPSKASGHIGEPLILPHRSATVSKACWTARDLRDRPRRSSEAGRAPESNPFAVADEGA